MRTLSHVRIVFKNGESIRADSPVTNEEEVEKSFWLSRPDVWVVNRKMKNVLSWSVKNGRLFGVILPGDEGSDEETAHYHTIETQDLSSRPRMGDRGCPVGRRAAVG